MESQNSLQVCAIVKWLLHSSTSLWSPCPLHIVKNSWCLIWECAHVGFLILCKPPWLFGLVLWPLWILNNWYVWLILAMTCMIMKTKEITHWCQQMHMLNTNIIAPCKIVHDIYFAKDEISWSIQFDAYLINHSWL